MSRDIQFIGMDVHKEAIVIAVLNGSGKLVMDRLWKPKPAAFCVYPRSAGRVACDLGRRDWAAWLYDLLKPHLHQVLVCDPGGNALLKEGNKSDKIDARKPRGMVTQD